MRRSFQKGWVWLAAVLATGCYSKVTNGIRDEPHLVQSSVPNGYRATAEQQTDAQAIHVQLERTALCRPGELGEVRHYQTYAWKKDDATLYLGTGVGIAGLLVGGTGALISAQQPNGGFTFSGTSDAFLGVAGVGLAVWLGAIFLPSYFSSSDETAAGARAVARWMGPGGDCTPAVATPWAATDVRIDARFAGAPDGLYWKGQTSADGRIDFSLVPQLGALSRSCGAADVHVSLPQEPAPYSSDAPDAPWIGTRLPGPVSVSDAVARGVSASGAPAMPTASLQGASRDTALRCEANRKTTCLSRLPPELNHGFEAGCAQQCGNLVDAQGPVQHRGECESQAQDDGDRQVCREAFGEALVNQGVDVADFTACVSRCVDNGRQRQCP